MGQTPIITPAGAQTVSAADDILIMELNPQTKNISMVQFDHTYAQNSLSVNDVNWWERCILEIDKETDNFYCFGYSSRNFIGNPGYSHAVSDGEDIFGLKLNSDFSINWTVQFDHTANNPLNSYKSLPATDHLNSNERVYDVELDADGNIYMCGGAIANFIEVHGSDYGYEGIIIKMGPAGQVLWAKQFEKINPTPCIVKINSSGEPFVAWNTSKELEPGAIIGGLDLVISKFNPTNGDTIWMKQYGPSRITGATSDDNLSAFLIDSSGDFYLGARTKSPIAEDQGPTGIWDWDSVIIKIDSSGDNVLWKTQFGPQTINSFAQENNLSNYQMNHKSNGIILSLDKYDQIYGILSNYGDNYGDNFAGGGLLDLTITKVNSANGQIYWFQHFGQNNLVFPDGDNTGSDMFSAEILFDEDNNMYITGKSDGSFAGPHGGGTDIVFLKFNSPL